MKYSLWLVPPEPIFSQLEKIIKDLSIQHKSPVFKPHITLLSGIDSQLAEVEEAVKKITLNTKKLNLSFGLVSFSTTYFQSVFIRVNSTAKLMQMNLDLKGFLSIENSVFMPHLSLLYGEHDMKTREKIASTVKFEFSPFFVKEVAIVSETPEPDSWQAKVRVPFSA